MSTYNPRLFRHLANLQQIRPELLVPFFKPHAIFLNDRGAKLPDEANAKELDYEALHGALLSPADKAPDDLVEALYVIDEIATDEGTDALREELEAKRPTFRDFKGWTPAERAIAVWLADPQIVQDAHARVHAFEPRRFFTWRMILDDLPELPKDMAQLVPLISSRLEAHFQAYDDDRYGNGQPPRRFRVFHYPQGIPPTLIRFLVRHAGKLQNAPSVDDRGDSYLALFRPEIYDVVIFDCTTRELRINAGSKVEQNAYATVFGEKLCGDPEAFVPGGDYTLEPLRNGPESLACNGAAGIKAIRLVEIGIKHGGLHNEYEIRRANDIFATTYFLENDGFPPDVPLDRAVFKVTFSHANRVRKVTLKPPRTAIYTRDADGDLIEEWLRVRGFAKQPIETEEEVYVAAVAEES